MNKEQKKNQSAEAFSLVENDLHQHKYDYFKSFMSVKFVLLVYFRVGKSVLGLINLFHHF